MRYLSPQYIIFTQVFGIIFLYAAFFKLRIYEFPIQQLALMGVSSGGYSLKNLLYYIDHKGLVGFDNLILIHPFLIFAAIKRSKRT